MQLSKLEFHENAFQFSEGWVLIWSQLEEFSSLTGDKGSLSRIFYLTIILHCSLTIILDQPQGSQRAFYRKLIMNEMAWKSFQLWQGLLTQQLQSRVNNQTLSFLLISLHRPLA